MKKEKIDNQEINKFDAYVLAFEDLNVNAQKELLEEASQKAYVEISKKIPGAEISDISYSKTSNGEVIFDIEVSSKDNQRAEIHHEYFSSSMKKIMEHSNWINSDIADTKRKDLKTNEDKTKFIKDVESSKSRVSISELQENLQSNKDESIIDKKNRDIDEEAKSLGIDEKKIEVDKNDKDALQKAENTIDQDNKIKATDAELKEKFGEVGEIQSDEKVTQHYTAKQLIGGEYRKYVITKNNGRTEMIGQKDDGTLEKVKNVENVGPHVASIAGADGKLETTKIQSAFNIKNRESDSGFGINNDGKITYERSMNSDRPIGYEMSEDMKNSNKIGYAQNVFDELNNKNTKVRDLADRKAEDLRNEESTFGKTNPSIANGEKHVDNIDTIVSPNDSQEMALLEIANKNNVSLERVESLYEKCRSAGLYDDEIILETIDNTCKKEKGQELSNNEEMKDAKNTKTEENNKVREDEPSDGSKYVANDIESNVTRTVEASLAGAMAIDTATDLVREQQAEMAQTKKFDITDHGDGSPDQDMERSMEPKNGSNT